MDIIGAAAGIDHRRDRGGLRPVVHLADRVGPEGKIYAEDINGDALRHLAERCRRVGFANVDTILGDLTDPKLPAGKLDLIFVISSYHHFGDPVALMGKARAALKPAGRLAIAEWIPEKDGRGEGTPPGEDAGADGKRRVRPRAHRQVARSQRALSLSLPRRKPLRPARKAVPLPERPYARRHRPGRLRALAAPDDPDAEHRPGLEAVHSLEPDRDLPLAGDRLGRDGIGDVEESFPLLGTAPGEALLADLPAVDRTAKARSALSSRL